jgi:hypothetical protein
MEVCSSTETAAPGASHFGNGRSRTQKRPKQTTISPGKRASVRDLPQLVDERPIANALTDTGLVPICGFLGRHQQRAEH